MNFSDTIRHDLYRHSGRVDFREFLASYYRIEAFRFSFWLRASAYFRARPGLPAKIAYAFCRAVKNRYGLIYGYQIPAKTEIGPGLYLGHVGSIVINANAKIGRNVNIAIGVTIGQTNRGSLAGAPSLGDRVWVGTNAVVVGRITIGDGALIAPGAFVNFDVPANAVVVGNPGKIVSDSGTAGYVENTLDD